MAANRPEIISLASDVQPIRTKCRCKCQSKQNDDSNKGSDDSDYENIDVDDRMRQRLKMYPERLVLDIGGQKFSTYCSTLSKYTQTRLGRLTKSDPSYDRHLGEYFFDRNPQMFANILDYYRTGVLHFPHGICSPFVKQELQFWDISESVIAPCCLKNYKEYEEEQHTLELLESMFDANQVPSDACRRKRSQGWCGEWTYKVWLFLEFPSSSTGAKVWAWLYLVMLVCSIAVICLETHHEFRVPSATREVCMIPADGHNSTNIPIKPMMLTEKNPKVLMYMTTDPHPALLWLDDICTSIFMFELLLRFAVWPEKLKFLWSFFNVIDILAVLPMFIVSLSTRASPCYWIQQGFLSSYLVMSFVCVFRAVRILKLIKHSRGLQIMYLSMKASLREILLLLLLIVIGTLVFSTMIYYAEFSDDGNFSNIPVGFWWSIVTMTTVGYGDITPKTGFGYLVGCLCALTGMLITGLPIPVIANSFHLYYSYAKLKDKLDVKKQDKHKSSKTGFHNAVYERDPADHHTEVYHTRNGHVSLYNGERRDNGYTVMEKSNGMTTNHL